ncbi:hypothetical protein B5M42_001105 [Paenibacillus athensensis]|uniref:Uncharacterized protein n=1 Tax=Paenibacillus athensensis TaxID=1967502 RepID=A0A4Y8Q930_9BACL|nr:hypothetical protein [Paenibacillus athensensis]MCD1257434.1 hypothetical protein [Paenibacillus athensensis]
MHQAASSSRFANHTAPQPERQSESVAEVAGESAFSGNRMPVVTPGNAAVLQRAVGNRAVADMLQQQSPVAKGPASEPHRSKPALQRKSADDGHHAESMSANNARTKAVTWAHGRQQIQRVLRPFDTEYKDVEKIAAYRDRITRFAAEVDRFVTQAREESVQWHSFDGNPNAHLQNWFAIADAYLRDPDTQPDLIHARFGYAIETLACQRIGNFEGLTVEMQYAEGHTRPDIVVFDGDFQVAWLDITSSQSAGHIQGKSGAGWKKRPFVYEILYNPLNMQEILEATNDDYYVEYGQFMKAEHHIELEERQKKQEEFRGKFTDFQTTQGWNDTSGNSLNKRTATQNFLFSQFPAEEDEEVKSTDRFKKMPSARGALNYLQINDGPFGFNRGDVSSNSSAIKALIDQEAAPSIEHRKTELVANKNKELMDQLKHFEHIPLVQSFMDRLLDGWADRDTAKTGMLLKQALEDLNGLNDLQNDVRQLIQQQGDWRVKQVLDTIEEIRGAFPTQAIFSDLGDWRRKVKLVHKRARLVYSILEMQLTFIHYMKAKKYNMFNWPREVGRIATVLSDEFPQDESIVKAAQQWMAQNPVQSGPVDEEVKMNEEPPRDIQPEDFGGAGGLGGFGGLVNAGGFGDLGQNLNPTVLNGPQPGHYPHVDLGGTQRMGINEEL